MPAFYASNQQPAQQPAYSTAAATAEYHYSGQYQQQQQQQPPQNRYTSLPYQPLPADFSDKTSYTGAFNGHGPHNLGALQPDPFVQYKCSLPAIYGTQSMYGQDAPVSAISRTMNAPMLPPIRVDERFSMNPHLLDNCQPQHRHSNASGSMTNNNSKNESNSNLTAKEEKAIGGVSAKLDYQMEQMIDFVTEMTVGMYDFLLSRIHIADIDLIRSIKPGNQYPPTFRKWVSQVLNATRLPSATIMLSLSYLTIRVRQLSKNARFQPTDRSLYQLLTVALILGSKFLDDNTFQNKSWAEVSNIAVSELNYDEREWLRAFGHRLHHDPLRADGYSSWEEQWISFKARYNLLQSSTVLHPLDTDLRRQRSFRHGNFSPSYYQQQQQQQQQQPSQHAYAKVGQPARRLELDIPESSAAQQFVSSHPSPYHPWFANQPPAIEKSPSTAPHTGPTTPDYYSHSIWNSMDPFHNNNGSIQRQHQSQQHYTSYSGADPRFDSHLTTLHSAYLAPAFNYTPNGANAWNCHAPFCQCSTCRHSSGMQPKFGPIVVG